MKKERKLKPKELTGKLLSRKDLKSLWRNKKKTSRFSDKEMEKKRKALYSVKGHPVQTTKINSLSLSNSFRTYALGEQNQSQ